MNKTNAIYSGFFAIAILVLMSGCKKYSESDIEGTWVYTEEYVEKDEYGNPHSIEEIWQFEFKEGGDMTRTLTVNINDIEAYSVSVEGTYNYVEPSGGFEDKKVIGLIETKYDLKTIKGHFNSDIYDDTNEQKEIEETWRDALEKENKESLDAITSSFSERKYYGLNVLSIDNNKMTIQGEDSKRTFKKK